MADKELTLFQEKHITTREKAAARLRALADVIENGSFALGAHEIALPEGFSMKVEFEGEEDEGEYEIELHWEPWDGMGPSGIV